MENLWTKFSTERTAAIVRRYATFLQSSQPSKRNPLTISISFCCISDGLHVHVKEARGLANRDSTGKSDPVVYVRCFDQERHTSTKSDQSTIVWDERLVIQQKNVTKEELSKSIVSIIVYDMDFLSKDLIGQFEMDVLDVYSREDHEMYNQWVPLTAPEKDRAGQAGGICGYVKLSIALLGPNDTLKIHPNEDDEDNANEEYGVLVPPAMKQELIFM